MRGGGRGGRCGETAAASIATYLSLARSPYNN